ncbi:MAG: hypothetical protein ACJAQZ_003067, partial [Planctomycetota bacterium]
MTLLAQHLLPAAVVLWCAHCQAQAPQPIAPNSDASHPAISAGQIAGVHANNGGLLGVAQSYRVTFEKRSVTFQPALGSEAPRAHTMTIKTEHIRRGGQFALQSSQQAPLRQHTRTAVTYAWPHVQERFTTRTDGLKHSFVFAQRPAGEGDLIVQL